jgi:ABC-type uncharacterized transport system substrate-binding protein
VSLNRPRQQHQYNNVIDAPVGHDTAASNVELESRFKTSRPSADVPSAAAAGSRCGRSSACRRRRNTPPLGNAATALAAKDATTSTPVVFAFGGDPIQLGFVASFNRPGGNLTGMSMVNVELAAKHIGLMHELLPRATRFALLINPSNPSVAEIVSNDAQAAGRAIGRQIDVIAARTAREIDEAFVTRQGAAALLVAPDTFFVDRRVQLATLATRYVLPTIGTNREYAEAGALMSYGSNIVDQFRQAGIYVGRILKGERAADLPVIRPTRFELVINAQTARILGIEVPPTLLARADEVIE